MGDSFLPNPGFPPPPPEPDIPVPNLGDIGGKLWAGAVAEAGSLGIVSKWAAWILNIVAQIVGLLLSLLVNAFAFVIDVIDKALDYSSDSFGRIIAATLHSLFGVEVDPSSVNTRRGGPDRAAVALRLGKTVTNTLFSGAQAIVGGGLVPTDAPANNFLAVVMNMEVNGWIESWFTDGITGHILEKYGDLKDGISRVMGLGRMSRQVFAAPIKILVHDPYTALLNGKYRPKAPDEQQIIRAFYRGEFDETHLSDELGKLGYTEQQIKWAVIDHQKFLPLDDVNYLLQRGTYTNEDAQVELQTQGYTLAGAEHIVAVLNDKRTFKYRQQMVQIAEEAYVRGDMDLTTFQQIVGTLNISQEEQTWISNVATLRRSTKVEHLSLGQIEKGIKDGVMSFADLQKWGARVNMPIDELALLELSIQVDENKQSAALQAKTRAAAAKAKAAADKLAAAQVKAQQALAQAADKGISASEAETLVLDGLWTFDHLRAFLSSRGYGPDAIDGIVLVLHDKLNKAAAKASTAGAVRSSAAAKGLSLSETEKAVVEGVLDIGDLHDLLTSQGYDAESVQVIVELTQLAADAAKVKRDAKAAAEAKAAAKSISLPELERAVRAGLTPIDTYSATLKTAGFDAMSITLLTGILKDQLAADAAAAAKKAGAGSTPTSKGITLAQLEQEIIAALRPIADYTAELLDLKYSAADAADLTKLLQLKVDQAKATAAHRAAAGQQLAARDISIAQAERAVKLSVLPIAEYQKLLQADNFSQHAIDVLSNSLLAEVAKTRQTQAAANTAAGTLAKKAISLPELERAVIAGVQPIETYTQVLTTAGYSAQDAATLTELLQLKVDQAEAAAAAHADAEGAATEKGLNLAQEEAAVLAGKATMQNYDAFLSALGYDVLDRSILEAALQTKLDAAAAKAANDAGGAP